MTGVVMIASDVCDLVLSVEGDATEVTLVFFRGLT